MNEVDKNSEAEKKAIGDISLMITFIAKTYSELSKYIGEMPVKLSYNRSDTIHLKNPQEYLESLKNLRSKYGLTHNSLKSK